MVPIAYMPSPIPRQVGWNLFARTIPFASAFPRTRGGSAPASLFSGPAQRSLTLRPTRSPSRRSDPLHQRLQQSRCLHRCSDCYRVERTSSRAGIPPLWTSAFTAHPGGPLSRSLCDSIHRRRHSSTSRLKNRVPLYKRTDRLATVCRESRIDVRELLCGCGLILLNRGRGFSDHI